MDFTTGLPKNVKQNDLVMFVVVKLSKECHFIPVKYTYKDIKIVDIFTKEISKLDGVYKIVMSNRDANFKQKYLFKGLSM